MYASQTSDENHWKRIIQNTLSSETANSTFFFYLFITQLTDAPCPCFTDTCESTRETFFCIFTLMKNPPMHSVLLLSHSVVSNSLGPCGLQHTSLPCPSLSPGVCSNLCPLNQWCHPTISSCHPLLLLPSNFPSIRVFSSKSVLHIRWASASVSVLPWMFRIDFL